MTLLVTGTITAGNTTNLQKKIKPNVTVFVKTGQYNEILPIIVPAECCIIGDELRAVTVEPRTALNSTLTPKGDFKYTFKGLERMTGIVGDIVTGQTVTATSGNSQAQSQVWPYAETTVVGPEVTRLARSVSDRINVGLGEKRNGNLPVFHDMSDTSAGRARDLVLKNKAFIQQEVIGYIADTYPNLDYSRTKCKQDVGLILDSIAYDLTYGGNWMSVEAGKAYFNGNTNTLQINSSEKTATLAAYAQLKSLMQTVGRNIVVNPTSQTPDDAADVSTVAVPQIAGTGGSVTVSTEIGNLLDDVIYTIDNGYDNAPAITYPTIEATADAKLVQTQTTTDLAGIQTGTIDFISKNFGSFKYNSATCRRDLTNIITDVAYDVALGTNYNGVFSGIAYQRPTNSYNLTSQRIETIGALRFARDELKADITDATAEARMVAAFNEIVDIIDNGLSAADANVYPTPSSLPTTNADDAFADLNANIAFIKEEINI